jgi:histidinol-phosphate phosphatase family protein
MIAAIIGGGKGERLKSFFNKPKFLIKIKNKTLIDRQIKYIKKSKEIKKIYLSINFKNSTDVEIKNIFKKKIYSLIENKALGTAGCLRLLLKEDFDDVLVVFGDLLLNFNFKKFIEFHKMKKSICSVVIHPNNHPYDSDMVEIYDEKIIKFYKKPHKRKLYIKNRCLSGIFIFKKNILKLINKNHKFDISRDLLPKIIKKKINIFAFENINFIKDVGTPQRLKEAKRVKVFNLKNRPAIFLDRDGVLNKEYKNEKFSNPLNIFNDTIPALRLINKSKYLSIVITNQPAIAKNFINEKKLNNLHNQLEYKLGLKNVFLNDIFYCPHHPQTGFKNENIKFKIDCNCRKPRIGLIKLAKLKYNLDLDNSYFIGNSTTDFLTAKRAGIKPIMIKKKIQCVKNFKSLLPAIKYIIKK